MGDQCAAHWNYQSRSRCKQPTQAACIPGRNQSNLNLLNKKEMGGSFLIANLVRVFYLGHQISRLEYHYLLISCSQLMSERNIKIPLEGRLDLVKIKPKITYTDADNSKYISTSKLVDIAKEKVEIIQLKTGKSRSPPTTWKLQADAETLLLMKTLNLEESSKYTWQFVDKDRYRVKFNFAKVHESISKYIQLWKSEVVPSITGFCPNCQLQLPTD